MVDFSGSCRCGVLASFVLLLRWAAIREYLQRPSGYFNFRRDQTRELRPNPHSGLEV